jgi:protein gp37
MQKIQQKDSFVRNHDGSVGFSSNPITGCLKRCSYCYALRKCNDPKLSLKAQYLANPNIAPVPSYWHDSPNDDPFYPRFVAKEFDEIKGRKKPTGIFLCDMSDIFGDWIPREWQDKIFETIRACPQHRFYLLTKQPQNLKQFSPYPENCWVGVSATDQPMAQNAIQYLRGIQAPRKYICFSPLLGKIDIDLTGIDWGIIAAQNNPYVSPDPIWVSILVKRLNQAGAKVFLKDNLKRGNTIRQIPV